MRQHQGAWSKAAGVPAEARPAGPGWPQRRRVSDRAQPEARCLVLRAMLSSVLPHYDLQVLASVCLLLSVLSSLLSCPYFPRNPTVISGFKESPVERDIWPRSPRHGFYPGLSHGRESWAPNPACKGSEEVQGCGHEAHRAARRPVCVLLSRPHGHGQRFLGKLSFSRRLPLPAARVTCR